MTIEEERAALLVSAAEMREREVMNHEVNIENYTRAIADIDANHVGDTNMTEFRARLSDLLESSIREKCKEACLLKVIKDQIPPVV